MSAAAGGQPPRRYFRCVESCRDCLGWGPLERGGVCEDCLGYTRAHPTARCDGCGRVLAVKGGYCRLCRIQANGLSHRPRHGKMPPGRPIRAHQLFLLTKKRGRPIRSPAADLVPAAAWVTLRSPRVDPAQLTLLWMPRDYTRFDHTAHADPANPAVIQAQQLARATAEGRGWSADVADEVDQALVVLLSAHVPGERVAFSEVAQVRRLGLVVSRTAEVIDQLGLLHDDRSSTFDTWLATTLTTLPPGIRGDVEAWARALRDGGPRSRPRDEQTVRHYLTPRGDHCPTGPTATSSCVRSPPPTFKPSPMP